jgi:outer membrane autotransporter protein
VNVAGQTLPGGALALADDKTGKPATGGGAAADKPDAFTRWGLFVNGDIDIGRQSAVDAQSAFKVTSRGITLGTDYRFEGNHVLGAAVGFLKADTDVADGGSQDAKGYSLSLYGSWVPAENAYVDGILNFGRNDYDSTRQPAAGGSITSSTDGNQFAFAVSAGMNINAGRLTGNPYVRVEYVDAKVDGFTENGSPGDALSIGEQRVKATTLTLGGQASYAISTSWGVLLPYGKVELQYLAQSSAQDVTALVVGSSAPATILPKLGDDKTFGNFAAGVSAILPNGFSCFFNYEQLFGKENFEDQRYTLGLRLEF